MPKSPAPDYKGMRCLQRTLQTLPTGGETHEIEIGTVAHEAAELMAADWSIHKALEEGYSHFAPVESAIRDVQLIGIARLTYRPKTSRTSSWYGESCGSAARWIKKYGDLRAKAETSRLSRKEPSPPEPRGFTAEEILANF